jgi:hypothetical protein
MRAVRTEHLGLTAGGAKNDYSTIKEVFSAHLMPSDIAR